MEDWIEISADMPPNGTTVMTKIDDKDGQRNVAALTRQSGLWYFPDASMYVYYRPTHFRPLTGDEQKDVTEDVSKPKFVPVLKFK